MKYAIGLGKPLGLHALVVVQRGFTVIRLMPDCFANLPSVAFSPRASIELFSGMTTASALMCMGGARSR